MPPVHYYTVDHPEANGRTPQKGEHAYSFQFPLADGNDLVIHCGQESMERFAEFLGSMIIDDAESAENQPTDLGS